jgi:hypothetical protein
MQTLTDTEEPQHSHRPPRNLARHIRRGDDGRPVDGDTLVLRPMCAMTDVCVAAVPAVRITLGFVTDRFIRRTASTMGPSCHRSPASSSPRNNTTAPISAPRITTATRIPTERN